MSNYPPPPPPPGDPNQPNAISRLRYHEMFLPKIVQRIRKTAPPGADLTSWVY